MEVELDDLRVQVRNLQCRSIGVGVRKYTGLRLRGAGIRGGRIGITSCEPAAR